MTCHNCEHNATIERLRKTCAACRLSDVATRNTVSFDALPNDSGAGEIAKLNFVVAPGVSVSSTFDPAAMMDGDAPEVSRLVPSMPEGAEEWLLGLLRAFADLSLADFLIVHGILRGWSFATMAKRYGASKQTISLRLKHSMKRNPWIAEIRATVARREWRERNDAGFHGTENGDRLGGKWVMPKGARKAKRAAPAAGLSCGLFEDACHNGTHEQETAKRRS